jgi:hypothetical protein
LNLSFLNACNCLEDFSDTPFYFNFDFMCASLRDVELHKHLGVIFRNDCNLPKPVIPSAMSFINTNNNNGPKADLVAPLL